MNATEEKSADGTLDGLAMQIWNRLPYDHESMQPVCPTLEDMRQTLRGTLAAAAPDLLEACRDMLEKIDRLYPNDWQGTKGKARAAIAKAEGSAA